MVVVGGERKGFNQQINPHGLEPCVTCRCWAPPKKRTSDFIDISLLGLSISNLFSGVPQVVHQPPHGRLRRCLCTATTMANLYNPDEEDRAVDNQTDDDRCCVGLRQDVDKLRCISSVGNRRMCQRSS